jgi:hypothetical protein
MRATHLKLYGNSTPVKMGGGMYVVYELWVEATDRETGYPYAQYMLSLN